MAYSDLPIGAFAFRRFNLQKTLLSLVLALKQIHPGLTTSTDPAPFPMQRPLSE